MVPILTDIDAWGAGHWPTPPSWPGGSDAHGPGTVLLFVGRLSPNKNQHHLVETLWLYRRWYDPEARLALVGPAITPAYADAVMDFAAELGLAGAVDHGEHLTPAQLAAWYSDADVFVCLSDHEGFCIPLLEAMHFDLPIVALAAGAVPETLGAAGILIDSKRPRRWRRRPPRVRADPALAAFLASAGRRRLGDFGGAATRARFLEVLAALDDPAGGPGVKLGFVTPRYGPEVIGGAETAARMLAERMTPAPGLGGGGPHQLCARPPHLGEHRAGRDHRRSTG